MARILITGAHRGIGLELARQYAAQGEEVLACSRDPARSGELEALARASQGRVAMMALDVADPASIDRLGADLGERPIDIVINNAGIGGPRAQSSEHVDPEGWMETLKVNALGPLLVAQALHANLKAGDGKRLVAITSGLGSTAGNSGGRYAYRASKAALNNVMRGLARDWAPDGILVAILTPGWVRTDMGGPSAALAPEESVRGLIGQIAALTPETSGAFMDHRGGAVAW